MMTASMMTARVITTIPGWDVASLVQVASASESEQDSYIVVRPLAGLMGGVAGLMGGAVGLMLDYWANNLRILSRRSNADW